jgi:hypothetical protein
MKKFFSIAMAVCVIFAMISCNNGSTSPDPNTSVTITYNANGWTGEAVPAPVTNKVVGDAIGAENLPMLSHDADTQRFRGWSLTPGQTGERVLADYKLTGSITLYALWQAQVEVGEPITISYNANGWTGGGVPTETVDALSGDPIGEDNLPVLTSTETQIFLGWAQTAGQTGQLVTANTTLYGDTTLYVRFTAPITLSFDYSFAGSTAPAPIKVGSGATIGDVLPAVEEDPLTEEAVIRPTYRFLGWFTAAEGGTEVTADSIFTADTTLYAHWESLPDWVFFELDLEWVPYTQSMAGTQWPAALPAATYTEDTETGKKVLNWKFTENSQRGLIMLSPGQRKLMEIPELTNFRMWIDGEIAEGQTAADQWRMFVVNPFATTDWQGTNAVGGQAAFSTLRDNTITWMDNRFLTRLGGDPNPETDSTENYRTQAILIQHRAAGEVDVTIRSIRIRYDGKVSAAPPPAFKVEFDLNYTNAPEKTITFKLVDEGGAIGKLPTATRSAFEFDGWYLEPECTTPVEETTTFNVASSVYAKWEALPAADISYDWNYSGAPANPATITIAKGVGIGAENLPDPDVFMRPTHVFDGWFTQATGGTLVTAATFFEADATLYAHWSDPPALASTWEERIQTTVTSVPVYGFVLPDGKTFGDYDTLIVKIKASPDTGSGQAGGRLRAWGSYPVNQFTFNAQGANTGRPGMGNGAGDKLLTNPGQDSFTIPTDTDNWTEYKLTLNSIGATVTGGTGAGTNQANLTGLITIGFGVIPPGGGSGNRLYDVTEIALAKLDGDGNVEYKVDALHPQSHLLWKGQGQNAYVTQNGADVPVRTLLDE